jgi:uncharacterized protein (TIGR02118 family)
MVKISIFYPNSSSARFDFNYYIKRHMPHAIELLSAHPGFRTVSVERGVSGTEPESPPAYIAACVFTFDTVDSFLAAFMPNAAELQADIPNYTDIVPQIEFSEVLVESKAMA